MQRAQNRALARQIVPRLRRHVRQARRTARLPKLGQTEVQQLYAAPREHDIAGLQVAVCHAVAMRLIEGVRDLDGVLQRLIERKRSAFQPLRQRLALEQFHHEVVGAFVAADVMQRRDVWMAETGDQLRFTLEPGAGVSVVGDVFLQDLDGHGAIEPWIAGFVDLAHSPRANRGDHFIRAQAGTGCERQGTRRL